MTETAQKSSHGGLKLALDYGPLIIFFVVYRFNGPSENPLTAVIAGTIAFMISIVAAVIVSKWKLGKVAPMLWLSAVLVIGFGGLTIYFNDPRFIQIKPTIIYAMLGVLLFFGVLTNRPMLKYVLEAGYDGLSERGWMLLSRNWAFFFIGMAALNEVMRAALSFDTWLTVKVWGITLLSLVFAAANIPMLMRHGLGGEDAPETVPPQG